MTAPFFGFCLQVSSPCVSWAATFSLSLRVPDECMSGDAVSRFPEGLANPAPPSLKDFSPTGCCLLLFHSSILLMVTGHLVLTICLRQMLMNVWILFMVEAFVLHVSAPYRSIGFTIILKSLILRWMVKALEFHTFFDCWKVVLVLLIHTCRSAVVPPCFSTVLSRQVMTYLHDHVYGKQEQERRKQASLSSLGSCKFVLSLFQESNFLEIFVLVGKLLQTSIGHGDYVIGGCGKGSPSSLTWKSSLIDLFCSVP